MLKTNYMFLSAGIPLSSALSSEGPNIGAVFNIQHIETLIMGIIALILIIVGVSMFICIVLNGLKWLNSRGDRGTIQGAQTSVTNCLIGLAIVMLAWAIMQIIQYFFGVSVFPTT